MVGLGKQNRAALSDARHHTGQMRSRVEFRDEVSSCRFGFRDCWWYDGGWDASNPRVWSALRAEKWPCAGRVAGRTREVILQTAPIGFGMTESMRACGSAM